MAAIVAGVESGGVPTRTAVDLAVESNPDPALRTLWVQARHGRLVSVGFFERGIAERHPALVGACPAKAAARGGGVH